MKIKGIQRLYIEEDCKNIREFYILFPCATITEIDGKKVDEICESCEAGISKGDECYEWHDGFYTCLKCGGGEDHEATTL